MYTSSAPLFDKLYHFKNYEQAANELLEEVHRWRADPTSLLDVGCATGKHVAHLKGRIEVEGLDISEALLEQARRRCPGVPFHQGDMASFDLGRRFDVVACLFASIAYVRTKQRLHDAIQCMSKHLNPGGILLVEPWLRPDQYWTENVVVNVADEDPKEKIVWMYVGKRTGNFVDNEIHFMVGNGSGVTEFKETHHMGLFSHDDYREAMANAGLTLLRHDEKGFFGNGLYVAKLD